MYDQYKLNRKCKNCGVKLSDGFEDNTCDNCWEVEIRIRDYLKYDYGKNFIKKILKENK